MTFEGDRSSGTSATNTDETLGPDADATLGPEGTLGNAESRTRPARKSATLTRGDLVGRYVVLGKLGAGGMGVVHAADASRSEARARPLREAQTLAKFTHPEIVGIHDVAEVEQWLAELD
jgi:hypothetical protein